MMAILLNCITLGMYQPCADEVCSSSRCRLLQVFDDFIFAFFAIEMMIKTIAMGITGKGAYMSDSWNRLDCFIVFAGALEYCLDVGNINLSAIRTIRVLRPLRAINRIPSMRILVMLLLDTLPMLGNVLLLCFFVFFIFGIVGVQLWAGLLRQRCYIELPRNVSFPENVNPFYQLPEDDDSEYICSLDKDSGMHRCADLPPYMHLGRICNSTALPFSSNAPTEGSCVDWNKYYRICRAGNRNPFKGAISFDNIGLAWVAIFLVISLEGWSDIMYYVQDAHSFWDWVYFVLLIVIGSFFMINLCLVVIATQFSETKKREMERMRLERSAINSSSSIASASFSEPTGCYNEIVKYIAHLTRQGHRRFLLWLRRIRRRRRQEGLTLRRTRRSSSSTSGARRRRSSSLDAGTQPRKASSSTHVHPLPERAALRVPQGVGEGRRGQAPCASPEISDVDLLGSPRRPGVPSCSGSDFIFSTDSSVPTLAQEQPCSTSPRVSISHEGRRRVSSGAGRSRLTCAQLLALSGTQGAALAASCASNFAVHRFCSGIGKGEKHLSAPTLIFYYPEGGGQEEAWAAEGGSESDLESEINLGIGGGSSPCCRWWGPKQARLKKLVDHRYFQRGILTAILVNTLSMGIEYHNQPEELTFIVEVSNLVFTGIFGFEMCMKILAEGLYGYISSGYNVFDGIIVILSIVELCHSSGSGLSVLRTFRLLRILKLVRFLPALRRQLVIMLRTVDNVAVFFALLILFIFIFSILGMNLFGCKFCEKSEDSNSDCDRKNFDSLLWAIVTVFQILTQEDWNIVLFNGMERTSHWAALYFVALMTFGNYVLFNLLVAILVEGFSAEDERKRSDESINHEEEHQQVKNEKSPRKMSRSSRHGHRHSRYSTGGAADEGGRDALCSPPIITHTAATPQGSPNNTLEVNLMKDLKDRLTPLMAFSVPGQSFESIDRTSTAASLADSSSPSSRSQRTSIGSEILMFVPNYAVPNSPLPSRDAEGFHDVNQSQSIGVVQCEECGIEELPEDPSPRVKLKGKEDACIPVDEGDMHCIEAFKSLNENKNTTRVRVISHRHCNGGVPLLRDRNMQGPLVLKDTEVHLSCARDSSPQYSLRSRDHPSPLSRQSSLASSSAGNTRHNSLTIMAPPREFTKEAEGSGSSLHRLQEEKEEVVPPPKLVPDCKNDQCEITEKICWIIEPKGWIKKRENYSIFLFPPANRFRQLCNLIASKKAFDYGVLFFISLNCITLAMERPTIPPGSLERTILTAANYMFTVVFAIEMFIKVIAKGLWYGNRAYFKSGWNVMDGSLVIISLVDFCLSFIADGSPRIFGILRVFRLLRSLRPLRVINRAPGLKLVVQTLLSSLRPIGNIVLICCTFFIIFGILGVQLFKGSLYYCEGPDIKHVKNRTDCESDARNQWVNQRYNFDNLGQALMALFVLSSKDGWVNIMYTGLDAVGVDQQPIENYNEWRLLYFISFLLLVAFFVLNMFVGVVVENFHRCREEQEKEEKAMRAAKRAKKLERKRRKMREPPYYINYSKPRLLTHNIITSKYFDLAIAAVIGLNVVTMATEFYMMPMELVYALKVFNYFFTAVFILEAAMKIVALGLRRYLSDRWNQLDVGIVILSVIGIVLEEMESEVIPINPTIIRVMRVLRIARVLKLLKMAKGIRALLDTVMQALPQVGNLGLLFFLLFFIFAALGVELFGRLDCTDDYPCQGLGEHAHFRNFGMAFLTLFRVATGDNWNGIMKDTLRENCDPSSDCVSNCCVSPVIAPLYFVVFVLMAQFVLVNVVVAVLMKHLEESHKHMDDDIEMDAEIERQLAAEIADSVRRKGRDKRRELRKQEELKESAHRKLIKMSSLPSNFIFKFSEDVDAKSSMGHDRMCDTLYSPLATISMQEEAGTSPALSWPVASTSDGKGRRHTLEGCSEQRRSVPQLSPTPLVGSVISLCSSEGAPYRSPGKGKKTPISKYIGPPIRMISAESSDDASAPSTTVIPADEACGGVVIQEVGGALGDDLSLCDVVLPDEKDDNDLLWYVEEEESATSTNGLLRNYPELRSQPGLDSVSWTASDDFSSTTISGTLSGAEAPPPELESHPQPGSSSGQGVSVSQSSSLRLLGVEEEEMDDVLVVDPNDQKAVLIIGSRRCSGMPTPGEESIGHCITKPSPDQC
ncbi:voltage-dependent T-type calcium channel subunit alpha-1G-like [Uloborus diversus]|uniref:voltage-dependent T-type calcium channel subunit alpha-1G-like n=1 Tax=Uloborus diversus TaxID=327109 RepID=UPI00240917BD|nr:voltage-dependent T-type calcium channel subunit alpha-1G-like [Uloborus diversus]